VTQRFINAIKRSALQHFAESLHAFKLSNRE